MIRIDALLVSINERLGGGVGREIGPLGTDWMLELAQVNPSPAVVKLSI